jgi:cytochrome c biogenesis protein CcmG/thiol:disulfide interchange protein DsbE
MKKLFLLLPVLSFLAFTNQTDDGKKLPSVNIKDMSGNPVNTAEVKNDGNPIVITFWATHCKCCKGQLATYSEEYETWQEETGVKIVAVSVDDAKTTNSVEPMVNASGWEFDIWMDPNGEFKRAMGVNQTPHTFLLDGNLNIVYSHNNFIAGDEEILYEEIAKVSKLGK